MLVIFTDKITKQPVAVNPKYVTCVFIHKEYEETEDTVIGMINGNIVVEQSYNDAVGIIQGQMH